MDGRCELLEEISFNCYYCYYNITYTDIFEAVIPGIYICRNRGRVGKQLHDTYTHHAETLPCTYAHLPNFRELNRVFFYYPRT